MWLFTSYWQQLDKRTNIYGRQQHICLRNKYFLRPLKLWVCEDEKKNLHLPVVSGVGYSPAPSPSSNLAFTIPQSKKEIGDYTNLFSRYPTQQVPFSTESPWVCCSVWALGESPHLYLWTDWLGLFVCVLQRGNMLIINTAFIPSIDRKSREGECVLQAIDKGHIHFPNSPSILPRTGGYHAGHIKAK